MLAKSADQHPVDEIIRHFKIGAGNFSYKAFGSGHINDTYLIYRNVSQNVVEEKAFQDKYLLQRINHEVFKDVDGLMQNMHLVTSNLKEKLKDAKGGSFTTVSIIPTHDHQLYYQDQVGNYWRVQTFISNSISYDTVTSEKQAFEAGYAFGKFQLLLRNMDVDSLKETIPDFHNMAYRFRNFAAAMKKDPLGRKATVMEEIRFALDRQQEMEALYAYVSRGDVPVRITHNDTKFNNVLLDQDTQHAICIIDLDTVMPGVAWYDFGDSVRTIINTADEDEKALEKIAINMDYFEAFTRGFLQETSALLTKLEIEQMAFSSNYMTFIMGLRFLTDYLEGDIYYKIKHEHHNLQRARAQFRLLSEMENNAKEMRSIVKQIHDQNMKKISNS